VREVIRKEGEQTHILAGFEGVSFKNPKRFGTLFSMPGWAAE